jgi:hypothetical protein
MNSTDSSRLTSEEFLDPYIAAARQQFGSAEIEYAAQRLRERLPREPVDRRAAFSRLSLAGAASILFAAISLAPFLFPGDNGNAFAQAQQWLGSFRTLQIETTVQAGQDTVTSMNIWLDDAGDMRIEAGDVATIVKAEAGMIYILPPDGQPFAQRIPANSVPENSIDWLEDIRAFQGEADLLAESRFIEGISAIGYRLEIGASSFVLWVDPVDNKPLMVESEMPDGATIRSTLSFDMPLPADVFDIPEGVPPLVLPE